MFSTTALKAFFLHKRTRTVLKLIIPLCVFFYYFKKLDLPAIKNIISEINLTIFVLSFIVLCSRNFLGALRSSILLKYRQLHYSIAVLAKYYFIGNFFNLVLPALVGRDIARAYYLYKSSSGKTESISTIVLERFVGTAALLLLSLLSIGAAYLMGLDIFASEVIKIIGIGACFGSMFMILLFNKRTAHFFERLISSVNVRFLRMGLKLIHDVITYYRKPAILCHTFFISFVFQVFGVIATYLIALSINSTVPFIFFLILLPVIWVAGMLPVSIGGLGVREVSFLFLFSTTDMSEEMAMAICLLWNAHNIGLGLIGGMFVILEGNGAERIKKYRDELIDR